MNILTPIKALGYPVLPLVPECSYCAAMRFALFSAMLTGCIFGIGSFPTRFWAYFIIGTVIGLIQVFFLWAEYHISHDEEGEE